MNFKHLFFTFCVLTILILTGCKDSPNTATLKIRLTDAPGDYDKVLIDIKEILVHTSGSAGQNDKGWITLQNINAGVYDLLELTGGLDTLLASNELPAGKISQIRIVLGSNNSVVINGATKALDTPSAMQSGLKLQVHTTLTEGITYEILLDFDAARSIVSAGNGKYNLKPVIRTIVEAQDGAIKGMISPVASSPAVFAISGQDTLASTYANSEGKFLLRGLQAGSYTVAFDANSNYQDKSVSNVSVTIGQVTDMGTITISAVPQ